MSRVIKIVGALIVLFIIVMLYQTHKSLPVGVRVTGSKYRVPAGSVRFLADRTYIDSSGQRQSEQEIFDEVIRMIRSSRQYVLLDMFLYNDWQGEPPETTRALSQEVTEALIAQKRQYPSMTITVVSDPLNTVYGGVLSSHFEQLKAAGITVVLTDLTRLRDSNPLYSVLWRGGLRLVGSVITRQVAPHPFGADRDKVPIGSWLTLLNFKANHRKLDLFSNNKKPAQAGADPGLVFC